MEFCFCLSTWEKHLNLFLNKCLEVGVVGKGMEKDVEDERSDMFRIHWFCSSLLFLCSEFGTLAERIWEVSMLDEGSNLWFSEP